VNTPSSPFRVLVVCTGNICRSPVLEHLWRTRLDPRVVTLTSAGTRALVDYPMPDDAQRVAHALGIPADSAAAHRAQQLTAEQIADADLVVALAREHRADIVRTLPAAARKTVTLREAARLIESLVEAPHLDLPRLRALPIADVLHELIPLALAERGVAAPPADPDDDDVVDPYQLAPEAYDRSGEQIADATARIFSALSRVAER
jgi:protein-tyrosine phosphatase